MGGFGGGKYSLLASINTFTFSSKMAAAHFSEGSAQLAAPTMRKAWMWTPHSTGRYCCPLDDAASQVVGSRAGYQWGLGTEHSISPPPSHQPSSVSNKQQRICNPIFKGLQGGLERSWVTCLGETHHRRPPRADPGPYSPFSPPGSPSVLRAGTFLRLRQV